MKHVVDADVHIVGKNGVEAIGTVTVDKCLRFSVIMRSYSDKKTGEKKVFLSYPSKVNKGTGIWKSVVSPNEKLREEIALAFGTELKEKLLADSYLPEVEGVSVTLVNQGKPLEHSVIVRGMADLRIADMEIRGICIKETRQGLLIQMPQYISETGDFRNSVYSTSKELTQRIREAVLEEYRLATGQ